MYESKIKSIKKTVKLKKNTGENLSKKWNSNYWISKENMESFRNKIQT